MTRCLYCLLLVLLLLPCAPARAQTDTLAVTISEVDTSRFPVMYLHVSVFRKGNMLTHLDASNFSLFENTIPQIVESLDCPGDTGQRFSVAILLDRSGSMGLDESNRIDSAKLVAAKSATRLFLDVLEPRDEACIYSFSSNYQGASSFTVNQNFTSDVDLLKRSLVPIRPLGGTLIWRAMMRTLDSLKSRTGKRIMIVLTDGKSQGEVYTVNSVITKAVPLGIPIYMIGLGSDIAETELSAIANATGGKFYKSPSAAELEQAFRQLAGDVITDACVLRYTSRDICKDGSERTIELIAHTAGLLAEDTATFRVPTDVSRYTVSLGNPGDLPGRTSFRIPVMLRETIGFMPLDYAFRFTWPAALLRFDSVATDGSISQGAVLQVDTSRAGSATISVSAMAPNKVSGMLFELAFTAYAALAAQPATIAIDSQYLAQGCPTIVTSEGADFTVLPCERSYRIGYSSTSVLRAGDPLRVPIELRPALDSAADWAMNLVVRYAQDDLEYDGLDSAGGIPTATGIIATHVKGRITLTLRGNSAGADTLLLTLLFHAKSQRAARATTVEIDGSDLRTGCLTTVANDWPFILINGICEQIVTRPPTGQRLSVAPNPSREAVTLRFAVTDDGPATIDILDESGRAALRVLDATLPRGDHRLVFDPDALPAGRYLVVLTTPGARSVHPLLLLR